MAMTDGEAVSRLKKIIHANKVYEGGVEALEVSRTARSRISSLTTEGDKIFADLKVLKNNERTARKRVEDWQAKAKQFEEDALERKEQAEGTALLTIHKKEKEVKDEILKLEANLDKANKIHNSEMEELAKKKAQLQDEVNVLQSSLTGLVSQVERIRK